MERTFKKLLDCLLLLMAASILRAQGGPPMISDDTGTPGNRNWEIESAVSWVHYSDGSLYQTPYLDLNYGVGSRIELNADLTYQSTFDDGGHSQGWGDTELACKWRFIDSGEKGWSVSTYPAVIFNTTRASIRSGVVDSDRSFFLPIEACRTFGRLEMNLEFGPEFHQTEGMIYNYGIVLGRHLTKRLELMAEYHDAWFAEDRKDERIFDAGFRYQLGEGQTLLFMLGAGPRSSTPEHTVTGIGYVGLETDFDSGKGGG